MCSRQSRRRKWKLTTRLELGAKARGKGGNAGPKPRCSERRRVKRGLPPGLRVAVKTRTQRYIASTTPQGLPVQTQIPLRLARESRGAKRAVRSHHAAERTTLLPPEHLSISSEPVIQGLHIQHDPRSGLNANHSLLEIQSLLTRLFPLSLV